jgi:DNA invertase Pin-like site-specific DNA recombinase
MYARRMVSAQGLELGAYLRLSERKSDDDEADTATQLQDCHAEAKRRGARITHVYVENDTSAFKQRRVTLPNGMEGLRVRRPKFDEMMRAMHDGVIGGFVSPHLDRMARQPRDLEDMIDLVKLRRVKIIGVSCTVDLETDPGILAARMLVAVANQSSRDTSRRMARKHRATQEAGLPGSGPRPFGFKADRVTHDEVEAALIRDAFTRLMTGAAINEVVREWNAAGVTTSKGNAWTANAFRRMFVNPRYKGVRAAYRNNRWETVTDASGSPVKAVWEPLLTPAEWQRLQDALEARAEHFKAGGRNANVYLLSGIARCGVCGEGLRGQRWHGGDARYSYACPSPARGGCGGVSRKGSDMGGLDEFVTEAVLAVIEAHTAGAEQTVSTVDYTADIDRLTGKLETAYAQWKADDMDDAEYFAMRKDLTGERKALQALQVKAEADIASERALLDAPAHWKDATLSERRALIGDMVSAVVVDPAPVYLGPLADGVKRHRRVNVPGNSLVRIVWKDA